MGACLCKGHKGLQSAPEPIVAELQLYPDGQPASKHCQQPANGTLSDEKNRTNYSIGELATSSLLGLVATIKEHITKPTAMAQGRVAHLIEWKGWGGGGGAMQPGVGWGSVVGGWGGAGAGLQEDEQLYSDLTDEIKEARFAAGVAQQFALAEAALSVWSSHDAPEGSNSSLGTMEDPDAIFLTQYLLNSESSRAPQPCYSTDSGPHFHPLLPHSQSSSAPWQLEAQLPLEARRTLHPEGSIRHADSTSLSEDEVFYD